MFKPGDSHRWVRSQRCSTAFCWAWNGQWLKMKSSFNSEFKFDRNSYFGANSWVVRTCLRLWNSPTAEDLQNFVKFCWIILTLLCRYTLHSECFGQSQSQNQSRPRGCLQYIQKRSSMDYPPELFVVLQPNVLIVPWPLRSPRKFKLTFSITLLGLQSSFSHWQTNEKKSYK